MPATSSRPLIALASAAFLLAGCAATPEPSDTAETPAASEAETTAAPADGEDGVDEAAAAADAAGVTPRAPDRSGGGLGLSRERIVAALAERDLAADAFSPQTLEDGRTVLTASFPEATSTQALWIGIFGPEAGPHTVRVDFFPVNAREQDAAVAGAALDRLLVALFPAWPEASAWPEAAGRRAWEETAARMEQEGETVSVPVLQGERDGVWLEALGMPERIVSYVVTTRESCRPSKTDGFYQGYPACR